MSPVSTCLRSLRKATCPTLAAGRIPRPGFSYPLSSLSFPTGAALCTEWSHRCHESFKKKKRVRLDSEAQGIREESNLATVTSCQISVCGPCRPFLLCKVSCFRQWITWSPTCSVKVVNHSVMSDSLWPAVNPLPWVTGEELPHADGKQETLLGWWGGWDSGRRCDTGWLPSLSLKAPSLGRWHDKRR